MVIEQLNQLSPKIPFDELQVLLQQIRLNLINPIQRLPRYQLFMKDILKSIVEINTYFQQSTIPDSSLENFVENSEPFSFISKQTLKHVIDLNSYFETHCEKLDVDLLKDQVVQMMHQWICLQLNEIEQLKNNYSDERTNEKWQGLDFLQNEIKQYQEAFTKLQKTDIYFMNMSNNFYKNMVESIEQTKQKYPSMTSGFMSRVCTYIDHKLMEAVNLHQAHLEKLEQQCLAQWNALYQARPGLISQALADIQRHRV